MLLVALPRVEDEAVIGRILGVNLFTTDFTVHMDLSKELWRGQPIVHGTHHLSALRLLSKAGGESLLLLQNKTKESKDDR